MSSGEWLTFLNRNIGHYLRKYRDEPNKWTLATTYAKYVWSTLTRSEQAFYTLITKHSPLKIYVSEHAPSYSSGIGVSAAEWEAQLAWDKLTNDERWLYMYPEDALK